MDSMQETFLFYKSIMAKKKKKKHLRFVQRRIFHQRFRIKPRQPCQTTLTFRSLCFRRKIITCPELHKTTFSASLKRKCPKAEAVLITRRQWTSRTLHLTHKFAVETLLVEGLTNRGFSCFLILR